MNDLKELRFLSACELIIATILGGAALFWLRPVLLPFVLALFFVAGITPVLTHVQDRLKAPRMVAIARDTDSGVLSVGRGMGSGVAFCRRSSQQPRRAYEHRFTELVQRSTSLGFELCRRANLRMTRLKPSK